MIRRNLTGGLVLALLLGFGPSPWVLAASLAPKVCRMACAGTPSCCCNPRPAPPSGKNHGPSLAAGKPAPACGGRCAVAATGANTAPHAVSAETSASAPDLDPISSRSALPERAGRRSTASCSPRAPPAPPRGSDR